MKRLLLIIALVGAGSPAAADRDRYDRRDPRPHAGERWRDYNGDDYFERDRAPYKQFDQTRWYRDYRSRWVTLANAFSATTNRQFITLRGQHYDRLRLEAVRGAPLIKQVAVIYANGQTQVIKINERFPRGTGEVLRLNREPISRLVIYTDPRFGGAYSLHAAQGRSWNRIGV